MPGSVIIEGFPFPQKEVKKAINSCKEEDYYIKCANKERRRVKTDKIIIYSTVAVIFILALMGFWLGSINIFAELKSIIGIIVSGELSVLIFILLLVAGTMGTATIAIGVKKFIICWNANDSGIEKGLTVLVGAGLAILAAISILFGFGFAKFIRWFDSFLYILK